MKTNLGVACAVTLATVLVIAGVANAHVTVWPRESVAGTSDLYTARVPTEKDVPTVQVRVEFPPEVTVSRFVPNHGWDRQVEKDSAGRIAAVTWSGGRIAPDELGLFTFSGRNASIPGEIAWKAYQTYADGSVVEWSGPSGSEHPASAGRLTAAPLSPAEVTQVATVGQVTATIALLDNSAFHDLEESIEAGSIPAGSLGKVRRARLVTAAVRWPEPLRENAHKLLKELGHLYEAIEAGNVAAAVEPAKEVHELEHDLSQATYAWLADLTGLATPGEEH
jgi:uncharacterized protein YcnI